MKQGTIKTLGVTALGAAMVAGGSGVAAADGHSPADTFAGIAGSQEMNVTDQAAFLPGNAANAAATTKDAVAPGQDLLGGLPVVEDLSRGGLPTDGLPTDGLTDGGLPTDALTGGGLPTDAVTRGGLPTDALTDGGLPTDALTGGGLPTDALTGGGLPTDALTGGGLPTDSLTSGLPIG